MKLLIKGTCFRCGNKVIKSELKNYYAQCLNCDEDLYSFEVINKKELKESDEE